VNAPLLLLTFLELEIILSEFDLLPEDVNIILDKYLIACNLWNYDALMVRGELWKCSN
jgi:hypothetical protein